MTDSEPRVFRQSRFTDCGIRRGCLLRQAHVHTQVIQQRLGHASSRTTTDIYGFVPDETDEEAANAVGVLFAASDSGFRE